MLQVVLIRPGSTDFDQDGRIQGNLDVPLSETGTDEVAEIATALADAGIEMIFASPCQSSEETAQALAARLDVKCKVVDKLRNLDHGLWQGMLVDEIKQKQPKVFKQWQEHPETVCPPEGEMIGDAKERLETVLAKIVKKHKHGVVAIVLPEPLASLAGSYFEQQELTDLFKSAAPCGSWQTIGVSASAPS